MSYRPCSGRVVPTSRGAKALAEQFILMAKAEALEKLGECRAAEALAEKLVREHVS